EKAKQEKVEMSRQKFGMPNPSKARNQIVANVSREILGNEMRQYTDKKGAPDKFTHVLRREFRHDSSDSLLFSFWRGLGFATAALDRSLLVHNILTESLKVSYSWNAGPPLSASARAHALSGPPFFLARHAFSFHLFALRGSHHHE